MTCCSSAEYEFVFSFSRSGFGDEVGPNNLCSDLYSALARARQLLPRFSNEDNL